MRKYIIGFMCTAFLTGCANTSSQPEASENPETSATSSFSGTVTETVTETAAAPETSAAETDAIPAESQSGYSGYSDAPPTFPVPPDADPYEVGNHYSFKVEHDGVWVYYDETTTAQFLPADCSWAEEKDSQAFRELKLVDFNFDGYRDLFVPEETGKIGRSGKYFRFKPEIGLFVIWKEMDEIGIEAQPDYGDNTLHITTGDTFDNRETKMYEWQDTELFLAERSYTCLEQQNEMGSYYITEYYTYRNGAEELYKKTRLFYKNGSEWPDVEELPLT